MKGWAQSKAHAHVKGKRFDGDIDKRGSVYLGYLGDAVFQEEYPFAEHYDQSDYDFLLAHNKIDVKSWWSKYKPRTTFFVQIPVKDAERTPDVYVFVCLNVKDDIGWLVGWVEAETFKRVAILKKKNAMRGQAIKYTADCLEMPVNELGTF